MEYTDRYKAFCKRMSIYRKLMDYDQAENGCAGWHDYTRVF